jgi:threonine/homoserine/homoserine lactone efflux protein
MTIEALIALLAASIIVKITPGPGVFATAAQSLTFGFRSALWFVGGVMLGDLVYIIAVLLGLSVIAREFHDVFLVIRILGGAYLIYLGIQAFRAAGKPVSPALAKAGRSRKVFVNGLFLTLGNPKVILFYAGLMPTFIDVSVLNGIEMAVLSLIMISDTGIILACYAYSASRARRLFSSPNSMRRMNQGAGTVLAGSGAMVIVSS